MPGHLILFDIDHTLADCKHRLHFILDKTPKDWDGFFAPELMLRDEPIAPMVALAGRLFDEYVMFLTARPERTRGTTVEWLQSHVHWRIGPADVLMRADDDHRHDDVVKEELGRALGFHNIAFVVEDRSRVVEMWRRNGVVCLQCKEGDY